MLDNAERTELEELRARVNALETDHARDSSEFEGLRELNNAIQDNNVGGFLVNRWDNGEWIVSVAKWGWGIAIVGYILLWIVDTFIYQFSGAGWLI